MESSDDGKNGPLDAKEHSLTSDGKKSIDEVLNGPNGLCSQNLHMDRHMFYVLCDMLQARGLLCHTIRIKIEEQAVIDHVYSWAQDLYSSSSRAIWILWRNH